MKKSILITVISSLLLFSFSNTTWAEGDIYYDPPKPNWEEIFENIESYPETGEILVEDKLTPSAVSPMNIPGGSIPTSIALLSTSLTANTSQQVVRGTGTTNGRALLAAYTAQITVGRDGSTLTRTSPIARASGTGNAVASASYDHRPFTGNVRFHAATHHTATHHTAKHNGFIYENITSSSRNY